MSRHRLGPALVALLAIVALAGLAPAASATGPAGVPRLVEIRAAHHPGFDRVVFEFKGGLPELRTPRWSTSAPTLDPSGLPSHVQGNAFLGLVFDNATGWNLSGSTYGPSRRAYDLPNVAHLVVVGDYEAIMEVSIGVMARTDVLRATALHSPSRWVIDIGTRFAKRTLRTWFLDADRVDGPPPYVVPVDRIVPTASAAKSLLRRMFAGPTAQEKADGLRFVASEATGFADLRINDRQVARVRLTGGCDGNGSTIATIATEIMPTLRQLAAVDWVKIEDPQGTTGRPWGQVDSIPACLEP